MAAPGERAGMPPCTGLPKSWRALAIYMPSAATGVEAEWSGGMAGRGATEGVVTDWRWAVQVWKDGGDRFEAPFVFYPPSRHELST